ncbi:hypothetical protein IQ07DRAFT_300519 [Pyrenochaeta sp. DS3sAY3a]|nr:hypothetical protein IQ07DRAFT_300519 [Pyrenochaeta sp. DS3sAY3a]
MRGNTMWSLISWERLDWIFIAEWRRGKVDLGKLKFRIQSKLGAFKATAVLMFIAYWYLLYPRESMFK